MEAVILVIDGPDHKHPVEFRVPDDKMDVVRAILSERYRTCGPVSHEVIDILTHRDKER